MPLTEQEELELLELEEAEYQEQKKRKEIEAAKVEDVAAPQIALKDRLIAKNLAQSVEKQAEFLKSKYPNLDIVSNGNRVLIKEPSEQSYKVLDPSSLEFADIGDIGDVVGAGIASTLGAVAGAPSGPVGAIAGSGLAGAGFESMRQKLGKALGIPQEASTKDALIAGGANMLGSTLLGTGLKGSGAYQGAIRQAWNKGLPKFAESLYGAPTKVIDKYIDERAAVEAAIPQKTDIAQGMVDKIRSALSGEKKRVGSALGEAIEGADQSVDIGPVIAKYREYIDDLQRSFDEVPNPINKAKLDEAKNQFQQLFGIADQSYGPTQISSKMKPSKAFDLQGDIKDFGDLKRIGSGVNPRYGSSATQSEKELSDLALQGYQTINKELDRVTEGASPAIKKQYQELMQMQSALSQGTNTPQQAYSTFTNLPGKSKTAFREQLEKLAKKSGQSFDDDITTLQAAEYFGDAGWRPKSVGGSTSTTGTIQGGLIGAGLGSTAAMAMGVSPFLGGAVGGAAGNMIASPAMLKNVIRSTDWLRSVANGIGRGYAPVTIPVREAIVQSPWDGM